MFNKGSFHWYVQRFTAIVLFLCFNLFVCFSNLNLFICTSFLILLLLHLEVGIENFIYDYMHDSFSIFISLILLDLLIIFSTKSIFFFVIFL